MSTPSYFAHSGNPVRRSLLSPRSDAAQAETSLDFTTDPRADCLAAGRLTTAAALPAREEFARFELEAAKAFPDLALEVGIASKRNLTQGWVGRVYVLRAEGAALGATRLETRQPSLELAIADLIRQAGPVRRAVRQQREAAALTRSQRAA